MVVVVVVTSHGIFEPIFIIIILIPRTIEFYGP